MIDARTRFLGVIGDPIGHTLSPALHNFVIQKLGLNYCYHAFQVASWELKDALQAFKTLKFVGINVTIPHKESVLQYLDELSEEAQSLGAVNTIHFHKGKLYGYNTDVLGFLKSLGNFRQKLKGQTAVVLGAGGSARAVIYGLIKDGIGSIQVYNRTPAKGQELVSFIKVRSGFQKLSAQALSEANFSQALKQAALLVNTTPVGMVPEVDNSPINETVSIPPGILVVDLIYNPRETRLLKKARETGATTINGLDMLIYQGLESLQIWTNQLINGEKLLPELREHLSACNAPTGLRG